MYIMVVLTVEHLLFSLATEVFTSDFEILCDFIMIENINMKNKKFLIKFYKLNYIIDKVCFHLHPRGMNFDIIYTYIKN